MADIFLEDRTLNDIFTYDGNNVLVLRNDDFCDVLITKQTGTGPNALEYWFGNGTSTPKCVTDGISGWSYNAGTKTVTVPYNYRFLLRANPSDGTTSHCFLTNSSLKAYTLKTVLAFKGNFYVKGQGLEHTILTINNDASLATGVIKAPTLAKVTAGASNTIGSDIITVSDSSIFKEGQFLFYDIGAITSISYQNDIHFYRIVDIPSSTQLQVDRKIWTAYSSKDLYSVVENVVFEDVLIDGRGGVNGLGGSRSGRLIEVKEGISNLDLKNSLCRNFTYNSATDPAAFCFGNYLYGVKLNVKDCVGTYGSGITGTYFFKCDIFSKRAYSSGNSPAIKISSGGGFLSKLVSIDSIRAGSGFGGSIEINNCSFCDVLAVGGQAPNIGSAIGGIHLRGSCNNKARAISCFSYSTAGGMQLYSGSNCNYLEAIACISNNANGGGVNFSTTGTANIYNILVGKWEGNDAPLGTGPNVNVEVGGGNYIRRCTWEAAGTYYIGVDTTLQTTSF